MLMYGHSSETRLDAVVFDVDGTLVDSERHGHRVAFNDAFAALGMADRWDETHYGELLRVAGGRRRLETYLTRRGVAPAEAVVLGERLHRIKTARFRDMAASGAVPLTPGVRRLVSNLQRNGVRLFVVTTGSPEWVEPLLAHHFRRSTFERVVTSVDVTRLKPEPDAYLHLIREARLDASRVVAVEDSANGLDAAQQAGLSCLVVRNEYTGSDVGHAELVVTGFGPHARLESGIDAPMPHGLVTIDTIKAVVGLRPRIEEPTRPGWLRGSRRSRR